MKFKSQVVVYGYNTKSDKSQVLTSERHTLLAVKMNLRNNQGQVKTLGSDEIQCLVQIA